MRSVDGQILVDSCAESRHPFLFSWVNLGLLSAQRFHSQEADLYRMTHTVSREVGSGHHNTFGPQLGAQFDFTLLFEDTILTILPASLLIATCPLYILHYLKQPVYVSGGFVLWTKLVSYHYAH